VSRIIRIEHLARIEGSAGLEVILDSSGQVQKVSLQSELLRGFESFCQGRSALEMPLLAGRICGICAEAHTLASLRALDQIFGCRPPANLRRLRRIYFLAGFLRDHLTVVSLFGAPDFGPQKGSPQALEFLRRTGRLSPFLRLREKIHRLLELVSGRRFQGPAALPGGWSKPLLLEEVKEIQALSQEIRKDTTGYALSLAEDFPPAAEPLPPRPLLALKKDFEGTSLGLLYPGGKEEHFRDYREVVAREGALLSGEEYLVGPLARFFLWPPPKKEPARGFQERLRRCLKQCEGWPVGLRHLLRVYECLLVAAEIQEAARGLKPYEPSARELRPRKPEGIGLVEAPRGLLVHHYQVDQEGYLQKIRILTPTAQNVKALEKDLQETLKSFKGENLKKLEEQAGKVVRAYDPCIPCMLHILIFPENPL